MGCVPERLHLFPREEGCRGRHGEAAIVTPRVVVVIVSVVLGRPGRGGGRACGVTGRQTGPGRGR